jgi:hypothetical protein
MKKQIFLAMALAAVSLGVLLSGCGGNGGAGPDQGPGDTTGPFTISGTVTFPDQVSSDGTDYYVVVDADPDPSNGDMGVYRNDCDTGTGQIRYEIADVPEGTYCIYAFVDVDGSGGLNTGDYMGFCGHDHDPINETHVPAPDTTVDATHLIHDFTLGVWQPSQVGTVKGTITLPAAAPGKEYIVILDDDADDGNGFVNWVEGVCQSPIIYEIEVQPGTYYLYAMVDNDGNEDLSDGDYAGYYGPDDPDRPQLPPAAANVAVGDGAVVQCDFELASWPLKYQLSFSTNGSGTVDPSMPQQVPHDTWFDIGATADAANGWAFLNWSSTDPGVAFENANVAVTKVKLTEGDATITANFTQDFYVLTLQIDGNGTTDPPAGIVNVTSNQPFDIEALPDEGHEFVGWTSDDPGVTFGNDSSADTTVTLSQGAATVVAHFQAETYLLTVQSAGNGTVTPAWTDEPVDHGQWINIEAAADCGYEFSEWTSTDQGVEFANASAAATQVKLTGGDATVTGNFDAQVLSIEITSPSEGAVVSGTIDISGTHTGPVTDITLTIDGSDYVVSNIDSPSCGEWSYSDFDSTLLSDGDVVIVAVANSGEDSDTVTVTVDNQPEVSGTITFTGSGTISGGTPLYVDLWLWELGTGEYSLYAEIEYTSGTFPRDYTFENVDSYQFYWVEAWLDNGNEEFGNGDFYGFHDEDILVLNSDRTGIDFELYPDPIADGTISVEVNNIPSEAGGGNILAVVVAGEEEPADDMSNALAGRIFPIPQEGGTVSGVTLEIIDPDTYQLGGPFTFPGGYYTVWVLADLNGNFDQDPGEKMGYEGVVTHGQDTVTFNYSSDLFVPGE